MCASIRRCSWLMALVALVAPPAAFAQAYRPIVDHVHLAAPDPAVAVAWYRKHFGGETMAEGTERLLYGDTRVIFQRRDNAQPSQGGAIDHIGFSVPDIDKTMAGLEADGAKISQAVRDVAGLFKLAFVEDPWGTRIEVVQDAAKMGMHHIHLRAPDPAATLGWYAKQLGASPARLKDRIDGIDLSGVWLLVQKGEAAPSQGRSIDHLGLRPLDVDAAVAALKAQNVTITTEPRPLALANGVNIRLAFAVDPGGVRLELVQRAE